MAFSTKLIGRHTSGTTGYSSLTSLAPLLPVSTTQHQGNTSSSNRSPTQTHGSPSVDSSDDKEAKHHRTERSGKYTKALFMFTALVLGLSGCLFAFWTWNAGHTCVPTSSGSDGDKRAADATDQQWTGTSPFDILSASWDTASHSTRQQQPSAKNASSVHTILASAFSSPHLAYFSNAMMNSSQVTGSFAGDQSTGSGVIPKDADTAVELPHESHVVTHQQPSVLVVTAIPPAGCPSRLGDYFNLLSVKNKMEYAQLHGYRFHLGTKGEAKELAASGSQGWSKVWLLKRLLETTAHDWILWTSIESVVENMDFSIPFTKYEDASLVLWGDGDKLAAQQDSSPIALSTDVLLLRNDDWSRLLLAAVADFGLKYYAGNETDNIKQDRMQESFPSFNWDFFDRNGFASVLLSSDSDSSTLKDRVYLEEGDHYAMNRPWNASTIVKDESNSAAVSYDAQDFIVNFAGCDLCTAGGTQPASTVEYDAVSDCQSSFRKTLGGISVT